MQLLELTAHKKARHILRTLSYPAPSSRKEGEDGGTRRAAVAASRGPKAPAAAAQSRALPLETALGQDVSAVERRKFLELKQPLAEDGISLMRAAGGSLEWVDFAGLDMQLDSEGYASVDQGSNAESSNTVAALSGLSPVPSGQSDDAATGAEGAEEIPAWKMMQEGPQLRRRPWPSLAMFEQFYHPPNKLEATPSLPSRHELKPLGQGRTTIAGMEASVTSGPRTRPLPGVISLQEREQAALRPKQQKPAGLFESTAVYRQACSQLDVEPLKPIPIFGECVEISNHSIESTRHCYAVAETVQVCAPKELLLVDAMLTDMGAARIVESAMMKGQLRSLNITGSCLSYLTCAALGTCLRTRAGASLTALSLRECGLGGDLDEELAELPERAASLYARSRVALLGEPEVDAESVEAAEGEPLAASAEVRPSPAVESTPKEGRLAGFAPKTFGADAADPSAEGAGAAAGEGEGLMAEGEEEVPAPPSQPMPVALPLFAQLARPGCNLKRLDLSRSALSLTAVACIGKGLGSSSLEDLVLNHCSIQDESLDVIAQGLVENRTLLQLHLRHNIFSGEAGISTALIDAASRHVRLALLDVAENLLPKECIEEFCSAFRWSCSLVSVHLLGAEQDPNAVQIAAGLRKWVAEGSQGGAVAMEGEGSEGQGSLGEDHEADAEGASEEMILCRALHVDGLESWRVVAPATRHETVAADLASEAAKEEKALRSWMPPFCWICSQCSAVDYRWVVPDTGAGDTSGTSGARLFVRPSFADFTRVELKRERISGARRVQFSARLLVPPGEHCHVFEVVVGAKQELLCSEREPSVELMEAPLKPAQQEALERVCRQNRYSGRINTLSKVTTEGFQIPEQDLASENLAPADFDVWAEPVARQERLRQCYEVDIRHLHLSDLCHKDEEAEVKAVLWELYGRFYDTYAIFAGRSQWPLIRQVDVYGFFEQAHLLDRGPMATVQQASPSTSPPTSPGGGEAATEQAEVAAAPPPPPARPLMLQDVQQMLLHTMAQRREDSSKGRRSGAGAAAAAKSREGSSGGTITRPQFIEVLLRAAILLSSRTPSTALSFRRFADTILAGRVMQAPLAPFPRGLLMEAGDLSSALLARRKTLREAWERFGGSGAAFQRLAQLLKLCDRSFTAKHVASIYGLSRRPEADFQPTKTGSSSLRYDEFCEAVARLALIWQRSSQRSLFAAAPGAGDGRAFPPQPQPGRPVKQKAIAGRLEAFMAKLAERMKPSINPF